MRKRWHFSSLMYENARRFRSDQAAAIAIQFAILLVPIFLVTAAAVDYARMVQVRDNLQSAADSAAVAMAAYAQQQFNAGNSPSSSAINAAGSTSFTQNAMTLGLPQAPTGTFSNSIAGTQMTASVTFSATVPSLFGVAFETIGLNVGGTASSQVTTNPYVDVYLMIDQSGSMDIGTTTADINAISAKTGCAFACHDNNNWIWYNWQWMDSYTWAKASGISMKFNVVNQGIVNFVNYVKTIDPLASKVRVALYSFDTNLNTLVPLTSNVNTVSANLPSAPAAASETAAATHFNEYIGTVANLVGTSGDGSSQANAKKIFILASDGVQDPGRMWASWAPWLRPQVAPFDFSFCATMKSKNVSVGILNTGYLPMPWDWGYNATVGAPSLLNNSGTRHDDIAPLMQACAGNLYIDGTVGTNMSTAFQTIFNSAVKARLTN